jgi:hypothetical protein
MSDEWGQDPNTNPIEGQPGQPGQPGQDDIDKRIEEIKRVVVQGAGEAQERIKRVVGRANDYWLQTQAPVAPHQATSVEEQRIRQLANLWSNENWRVARDLGTYMDLISWSTDEVWEVTLQTRWEVRNMEIVTEAYTGRPAGMPKPLLPVWDYELPPVAGLKAPQTRTRVEGVDDVVACTVCNGTGHVLCSNCTGRGWIVCPDCKGRTKRRCTTCRGRGYIADWTPGEKKPFIQRKAEGVANAVGGKVSNVFDNIRQQGLPIPNPLDADPASKGPTVPCPDCINGEAECTCGNGKRVCPACQGAKMAPCSNCGRTGKLVRHREIVRRFDLRTQTRFIGECPIPQQQLAKSSGDLIYSAEVNETLHPEAPPERVPIDIWRAIVEMVRTENQSQDKPGSDMQGGARPALQVIELVRIPYTKVQYRYSDQDYVFYTYDSETKEKFYADRFPARWDRIERLVKAISTDLLTPAQKDPSQNNFPPNGYGTSGEYSITEEDDTGERPSDHPGNN